MRTPKKWGITFTPISPSGYTATTSYPVWNDNLAYLTTTYKPYVRTTL